MTLQINQLLGQYDKTQGRLHVSSYNEEECSRYCHSEPTFASVTFTIVLSSIT